MKNRLTYDPILEQTKPLITFQLSDFYKGAKVDSAFLDYHNDTCPRCQKQLEVNNNLVQNVGTVSGFYSASQRTVYLYAVCYSCVNEISILAHRHHETIIRKAKIAENYIINQLQVTET